MSKKSLKIVVGYPPTLSEKGTPLLSQNRQFQYFNNPTFLFPVTLATGATWLRNEGYETHWKDAIAEEITEEAFYQFLDDIQPDLFIFETKSPVVKKHWEAIDILKKKYPKMKTCIMGDHIAAFPEETMERCNTDFLICGGYYDFAMVELAEALENKKEFPRGIWYRKGKSYVHNGRYELKRKLDDAPIVDRIFTRNDLYQKEFNLKGRPLAYIMSGRDCWWGRCTFCVWDHTLYPKGTFRARSPENVMEEVKYLVDTCGVKEIFDDAGTITVGPWLKKFCDLMISSGYNNKVMYSCNMRFGACNAEEYKHMKAAGFRLLKYGLESGCQKTIDKLDKGTRITEVVGSCRDAKKAGLTVHLTMMVGYPWETKKDALETIKLSRYLMRKGHADVLQSTVIVPYPGTPLWKEGIEKGWFREGINPYDYERFDMAEPVFTAPDMNPQEVEDMCKKIYYVFIHPEYIVRHLAKIRNMEDVIYTLKGVKAVAGHLKDFSRPVHE
ncbi:MAG: radical SAM protein [Nanoarchaeota archaeon]|nr:radical SAM protein [Nanoarchaeota archaeon]